MDIRSSFLPLRVELQYTEQPQVAHVADSVPIVGSTGRFFARYLLRLPRLQTRCHQVVLSLRDSVKELPVFRHTCLLGKVCVFAAVCAYVDGHGALSLSLAEGLPSHPQHLCKSSMTSRVLGFAVETGQTFCQVTPGGKVANEQNITHVHT